MPWTISVSSLYKAFPAPKAWEPARKLEIHCTPGHGSWLNIAEIAISILSKQCIGRRIPDISMLNRELAAGEKEANASLQKVARFKLKRLYPVI